MANQELPPITGQEKPAWVLGLPQQSREKYEQIREADIQRDAEIVGGIMRSFEEMGSVSDELISYLGLRFATAMRDGYDEGIQVGTDGAEARFRRERDRFHETEVMRLGGWG